MQDSFIQSLGWNHPLEKRVATHSGILAWEIPWTEEPGGPQSMGVTKESGTTEQLNISGNSCYQYLLNVDSKKKWISYFCITTGLGIVPWTR